MNQDKRRAISLSDYVHEYNYFNSIYNQWYYIIILLYQINVVNYNNTIIKYNLTLGDVTHFSNLPKFSLHTLAIFLIYFILKVMV